ncbi:hypothetical protein CONPUDRAFT_89090 [Coniophora puteana RWD-64-598 SS2]|uniref:PWWP domain-containing protein n=1 Tax=Coniophora puteana (strain RWD-64-598) TaxID=741705 RepID=A0A5M3MVA2_CONPW|nr:uncharacterized protein CONPUDRAFT_89090 [Coniophora puteana RWD-64-598 SS2]EIW83102.1 hypothetical protein CONPUDRAFT_89090 [Coniophora puteana RWD-64-598 SS2]
MSKKSATKQDSESSYAERDIVLAKVRGFPPWPGMVVNPDKVPPAVAKERPTGKKTPFFCVRFFPVGDYAWLVAKDISMLKRHEIEAWISDPPKRSGDLLNGYRIALNPEKWEEEKSNAEMAAAEQEGNAEVDQLDSEEEDDDAPKKVKKRKRDSEAASSVKSTKVKPRKSAGSVKGKKSKSKDMVESEDDGENDAAEEEDAPPSKKKAAPPPSKKAKKDKDGDEVDPALEKDPEARKVREWRHKLQKALLSKSPPSNDDMIALDQLFTTVEAYEHENIIQYLSFSKIGKVMRHIFALPPEKVPRDDEFKFRQRAKALVDKWHAILGGDKANENGTKSGANGTNGTPANGVAAADSKPQSKAEAKANAASNANGTDATAEGSNDSSGEAKKDASSEDVAMA